MKTTRLEHDLLLSESGELSARRRKRLDAAIAASPGLQATLREMKALRALWKDVSATTPLPAEDHMRRIHREITSTRQERRKASTVLPFRLPLRMPAIAAAAALFLAIGLYLAIAPPRHARPIAIADSSVTDLDSRIEDVLDDIDTSLLTLLDSLAENGNAPDEESDALALELIFMEDS